jgi:hypothetical protein
MLDLQVSSKKNMPEMRVMKAFAAGVAIVSTRRPGNSCLGPQRMEQNATSTVNAAPKMSATITGKTTPSLYMSG